MNAKSRFSIIVLFLSFAICPLYSANVEVLIQNSAFSPNPVTVNVGDTVTWRNVDGTVHTSTSGAPGAPDGKWDSSFLANGQTFPHTFDTAGTFPYFCGVHTFMQSSVIVQGSSQGPTIAITSPANNSIIPAPGAVTIVAEGSAPGSSIVMVEFFDGSTFVDMDHDSPFSITANLGVGQHSLTAKATTGTGATVTSVPVTITVNAASAAPTVAITSPSNNSSLAGPTNLTISAEASVSPGSIAKVEFFDGSGSLGADTASPFSVTSNLAIGSHALTAVATTDTGMTATSAVVNVTIAASGTKISDPYPPIAKGDTTIELQTVAEGLGSPLGLAAPDDNSNRLFVFDQIGKIYVLTNGVRIDEPLLDVSSRLVSLTPEYDERGLLGVAAHPNFTQSPFIYTYTSEPNGPMADFMNMESTNDHQGVIAEWKIDPSNTNRLDPASRREILRLDKPQSNHNGGGLHFGPDGMLYISIGDGGAADDQGPGHSPGGNGQDLTKILGKVARIDVDARTSANGQYGVPTDNPFVGIDGLDEIYAYGFRNPYSWSFDRLTGELYLGDVGQNDVEELDRVFKGGNYGWPIKEGSFYFDANGTNDGFITSIPVSNVPAELVDPIADYDHSEGIAIVGGYMYHGSKLPGLIDRYVGGELGNFGSGSGRLFYLDRTVFKELRIGTDDRKLAGYLKGFGQDQQGELYVFASTNIGPGGTGGRVFKIVPATNSLSLAIAPGSTNVIVSWTGGVGPFVVQEKEEIDEDTWSTVAATADRSVSLLIYEEAYYFRVADMAGNGAIPFTVYMTGAAERPNPVNTTGTGTGTLSLEGNTLHFDVHYTGLSGSATLAHIHGRAKASAAAGVMINLAPYNGGSFGTNGTLSGSVTLTPDQKAAILAGETYVNVHTGANPGGEIRGQIAPVAFMADLSGENERPDEVDTAGRGSGIFMLAGNQLTFDMAYHDLSGIATLAHIHGPADEDTATGVLVNLAPFNGGAFGTNGTIGGTVTLTPDQIAALVDELTYANVHTPAHPGGEIRGQLKPHTAAIPLTASLSGAAERPTPTTNAAAGGSGSFVLEGNKLYFNVRYSGLSGTATLAHIHGPATAAQAAGVLINLAPFNGGAFGTNGTLNGSVILTDEQRALLLEGRTYVNIHTPANPGGEIRGQIIPVAMQASLSGAGERPSSVQTPARARGTLLLVGTNLMINATYSGLSGPAVAAHIHGPADTSGATGVMINFQGINGGGFSTNGAFAGTVPVTPEQLAALVDRLTYMNIHTGAHGGGEIRGQVTR
jgi:glucose/arabinose dehydrogenase/plastocyanin